MGACGWADGSTFLGAVGSGWRADGCGAGLCSWCALPLLPAAVELSSLCPHPSAKQVFYRVAPDPTLACINEGLHVSGKGWTAGLCFAPMLPCFAEGLLGVTAIGRLNIAAHPWLSIFLGCLLPCRLQEMREFRPDVIIALGGGSPMDAAKVMWLM